MVPSKRKSTPTQQGNGRHENSLGPMLPEVPAGRGVRGNISLTGIAKRIRLMESLSNQDPAALPFKVETL
jgi:hypothetical protein